MKKVIIVVILIIGVGVAGFLDRHKIKEMMSSANQTPVSQAPAMKQATAPVAVPSDNIYLIKTDATKGKYLTDFQGMTLYTFDKDTANTSTCTAACAQKWPAYTSGATAQKTFPAHISVITRTDGSKQFAWDSMPLYYFASDTKAGELLGDGVAGIWHIVKQ